MEEKIRQFREDVWDYYARHARVMPWRIINTDGTVNAYHVLVSEVMLQQTQVQRVIPKFKSFTTVFPTIHDLAHASLGDVIRQWQGLGYNRRAKFLWESARIICDTHAGSVPLKEKELVALPGIGTNTAAAILCYANNIPVAFIETNIRTVYIHTFFDDSYDVSDADILTLVERTCDRHDPRNWYWALMDYGTFLKNTVGNKARQSKSYTVQSAFKGSLRQLRGQVLSLLSQSSHSLDSIQSIIADTRLMSVMYSLEEEGFIKKHNNWYELA